jgi:hypothetical protein
LGKENGVGLSGRENEKGNSIYFGNWIDYIQHPLLVLFCPFIS